MQYAHSLLLRSIALPATVLLLQWCLPAHGAAAGTLQHDELQRTLELPDDTAKMRRLSDLCFAYRRIDGDSALLFGDMALRLARKLGNLRGEAQALNDMSIIHMDRSSFNTADSLLQRALVIRTALHDSAGMGAIHNKLGNIHQSRFRLEEALEENFKALGIYERIGPPSHEALVLNNIAILQFNLRRLEAALATHRRAAAIRERIGDGSGLAASQGNMANVLVQMGDTAEALPLYGMAIDHFRRTGRATELAVQLHNVAGIEMGQGRLQAAAAHFGEALAIRTKAGDQKAMASSKIGLGGVLLRQGRQREARRLLLEALATSKELGLRHEAMQALLDLSRLHAGLNAGDSTFWYHQRYTALRDSVFNADLQSRMADLEIRYETERKEREIVEQRADLAEKDRAIAELGTHAERRKFQLAASIGGLAFVLLSALLGLQVQRRRARAARDAAIITERESGLRSVMRATDDERKRLAGELHDGVGQQLTGLKYRLEHLSGRDPSQERASEWKEVMAIADDASRDVRTIAHSMMPRALDELGLVPALHDMFRRAFGLPGMQHSFEPFGLDERLPPDIEVGVYRIAQELTANILKHAGAQHVSIQLMRNKGFLVMMVEDDGRGIDTTPANDGIGMRSIADRARMLHGTFDISGTGGQGTVATLRIPLPQTEHRT